MSVPSETTLDLLALLERRRSARVPFDPNRPIRDVDLCAILEGARWAPTAHNMQNFEIVVVDDREMLERIAAVKTEVSPTFVEENYAQLSFSEDELRKKKVGLLAAHFPPSWSTPGVPARLDEAHAHAILGDAVKRCAALLVVVYDPRRRAPASEGDALGMISLGCALENMWLVATSLGIGFQVQSVFDHPPTNGVVKAILEIPAQLEIAFAIRLGYPLHATNGLHVRRDLEDFTHRNRYARAAPRTR